MDVPDINIPKEISLFKIEQLGFNPRHVIDVLDVYQNQYDGFEKKLLSAFNNNYTSQIMSLLHILKGSSGSAGFQALYELCSLGEISLQNEGGITQVEIDTIVSHLRQSVEEAKLISSYNEIIVNEIANIGDIPQILDAVIEHLATGHVLPDDLYVKFKEIVESNKHERPQWIEALDMIKSFDFDEALTILQKSR